MWMLLAGLASAEGERPFRVGLGAGAGSAWVQTLYWSGSARGLVPVGSLRFLIDDRLILEPSVSFERATVAPSAGYVIEDQALELGLTLKPLFGQQEGVVVYPVLTYGRLDGTRRLSALDDEDVEPSVDHYMGMLGTAGVGAHRWFGSDLTLSIDINAAGFSKGTLTQGEGEDREEESTTIWGFNPSARVMLHFYW